MSHYPPLEMDLDSTVGDLPAMPQFYCACALILCKWNHTVCTLSRLAFLFVGLFVYHCQEALSESLVLLLIFRSIIYLELISMDGVR